MKGGKFLEYLMNLIRIPDTKEIRSIKAFLILKSDGVLSESNKENY